MKSFSKRVSLVEQIDFLAHFAGVMKKNGIFGEQIIWFLTKSTFLYFQTL